MFERPRIEEKNVFFRLSCIGFVRFIVEIRVDHHGVGIRAPVRVSTLFLVVTLFQVG